MKKVTKAIIPAAGLGTRMLPISRAVPKEMLPIMDYPAIYYLVKEAADSGITEFTISSRFSDLIPTLAAFDKLGFKMAGMTEVNAAYTDWQTGKHPRLPAIRLERR